MPDKRLRRPPAAGLDAAGKTTILYKLHIGEVLSTVPTIGFNVEKVRRAQTASHAQAVHDEQLVQQAPTATARLLASRGAHSWRPGAAVRLSLTGACLPTTSPARLPPRRRAGAIQERRVHCVGRGWPGEAAPAVAPLLQQHRRAHLRCRLLRPGARRPRSQRVQGARIRWGGTGLDGTGRGGAGLGGTGRGGAGRGGAGGHVVRGRWSAPEGGAAHGLADGMSLGVVWCVVRVVEWTECRMGRSAAGGGVACARLGCPPARLPATHPSLPRSASLCCAVPQQIVDDPLMRHSAILVFANKQDLRGALSPAEACEAMGLPQMKGRKWHVQVRKSVGAEAGATAPGETASV